MLTDGRGGMVREEKRGGGRIGAFGLRTAMLAVLGLLGCVPGAARGYSVQTHEQLVDLAWTTSIRPLLLRRYPALTQAQLDEAHAYAYGGCAIQDLGYYPGGNEIFSDLTHYVRPGDFVQALLREARTADELAFAIGALSHFIGDTIGHPEATNPAVAEQFPDLARKFGPSVAYEDGAHAHVRAEFAFDINELAKHRFAPPAYLRHVGLMVAYGSLYRAFYATYGLDALQVLGPTLPTIRGYRFAVRNLLPRIAYAEVVLHGKSFVPDVRDADFLLLEQELARAEFERGWKGYQREAGFGTHLLAGLIVIAPKVGPLSMLAIRGPDAEAERRYVSSVNHSVATLRVVLGALLEGRAELPNRDLDTGLMVAPGGYRLTDRTYARLLDRITRESVTAIPAGLKRDLLAYYADPEAPISTKKDKKAWAKVQKELEQVRGMATRPEPV